MKEWDALRAAAQKQRKLFEDGLEHSPANLQPIARAVLEALDAKTPPKKDAQLHGAMLALVGPSAMYKDHTRYGEVLAFQLTFGLAFALEAALASTRYEHAVASLIGRYTEEFAWLRPAAKDADPSIEPWVGLRKAAREAKPADRHTAIAIALDARSDARIGLRSALAWVFPDEPKLWTEEDARYGLVCTEDPGSLYDLASLRHVELDIAISTQGYGSVNLPEPEEIAKHLGKNALPALRHHLIFAGWDAGDSAAGLVASIGGPDAIRVLAEGAHLEKSVLPKLFAAAIAEPAAAAPAIADLLSGPLKKNRPWDRVTLRRPILEALLRMVLAKDTSLAKKLTGAAAKTALAVALPVSKDRIADVSALPAPLAAPPWAAKPVASKTAPVVKSAKAGAKTVARLAPVAHAERLDWGKRDPKKVFEVDASEEKQHLATVRREQKKGETFFLHTFMWLGDKAAMTLLDEIPVARWYGGIDDIEAMLARFGLRVLASMIAYVKRQPDRFAALLAVDSPRVASLAAHLYATSKKNAEDAESWLSKFPRAAAIGLAAALATEKGKAKESIDKALAFVSSKDKKTVDQVLAASGATALVQETRSAAASKPVKAPKLAPFLNLELVAPPRTMDGARLSEQATRDLASLLVISDRRSPLAALTTVAQELEPASLDRFAWSLFVQWLAAGGPTKHPSGLDVMGWFGSPSTLRTLAEAAREWAPGGLPQRAQAVVDVLALARGTAGLGAIHRLTQVRSRALARHAEKGLVVAAKRRGIAKEDLVDQLVPDLGLESDGTLTFDFGKQKFTLAFDEKMTAHVIDRDGNKLADLPKPTGGADEDEGISAAVAQWKDIKKKAKDIVREQSRRLEIALATERRFSVEHFESSFAKHPLLQHLARRLVWGAYRRDDTLAFVFRLAEDGTYAGDDDETTQLAGDLRIGLVHPLRLDATDLRRWGERLSDYDIIQPFDQLARSTHAVTAAEKKATALARTEGAVVPTGKILGLDRLGWVRANAEQGGRVHAWHKQARGLTATLTLEPGIYLGAPLEDPKQTLGAVIVAPESEEHSAAPAKLGAIDPVFFSELARDLETLT